MANARQGSARCDSAVQGGDALWRDCGLRRPDFGELHEHLEVLETLRACALSFEEIASQKIIDEIKRTLAANKMGAHIRARGIDSLRAWIRDSTEAGRH